MSFAQKFIQRGATRIVGVPKTIDNDLEATDYTVGFQTAVEVVVEAIERLQTTAESHERIMIVEVMGRYAGWIALTSALAGGAHVCLIPEIDYDPERVIDAFHRRHGRGVSYSIVVVARARSRRWRPVRRHRGRSDQAGEARWRWPAARGHDLVEDRVRGPHDGPRPHPAWWIPVRVRSRARDPVGVKAVELIAEGKFGHVAAVESGHIVGKPIDKAVRSSSWSIPPASSCARRRVSASSSAAESPAGAARAVAAPDPAAGSGDEVAARSLAVTDRDRRAAVDTQLVGSGRQRELEEPVPSLVVDRGAPLVGCRGHPRIGVGLVVAVPTSQPERVRP